MTDKMRSILTRDAGGRETKTFKTNDFRRR